MAKDHQNNERRQHILFNDSLNTFYLWLYGIIHMVTGHRDSSKESFISIMPQRG